MKQLRLLFIFLLTAFLFNTVPAQEAGSLRGSYKHIVPQKIQKFVLDPLPAGTYTIGTGGDFTTIDSAFNKLSIDGIAGPVVLELIDDSYTAPADDYGFLLNGPVPGADENNRVTIKPGTNKNVTIEGSGWCVVTFLNTNYLTVDGVSLTGPTTLTFHALYNNQFDWNDALVFFNNSDHNIVQNVVSISEDIYHWACGIAFYTSYSSTAAPDSNLIQNNFIKKAGWGIYIGAPVHCAGNVIRSNQVGSESDTSITWGIQLEHNKDAIVENNVVQNINQQFNSDVITLGINSYSGFGCKIRNNIVHGISSGNLMGSVGILLSGGGGQSEIIYNNMIYDIQSTSAQSNSRVAGIEMWAQNNPMVYYNTVYLSGTGSNQAGSAAFCVLNAYGGACTNVDARNNIFINERDESPYCASSVFDYTTSNLTSNYNDLYYSQNQNNCLVRISSANYLTLEEWQQYSGKDSSSITEMPNFIEPYLHIDETIYTNIDSGATPISGIDADIDGHIRNPLTPDIGADEFDGPVGIYEELTQPVSFILGQNYPNPFNPSTKIKYSIPHSSNIVIKVFDILGNEVVTLVNEEKRAGTYEITWNTADLPSGVYFYQLRATPVGGQAGDFVQSKKMILLR